MGISNMIFSAVSPNLNKLNNNSQFQRPYLHRATRVMAKYGDESIYFVLGDMENTVGSWEVYGEDGKERYPALQEEFFIRAGQALNRRTAMSAFLAMSGTAAILIWGAKGSKDAKLPITVGPQQTPQVGPRGRI